jgi:hypothetical protein
LQRDKNKVNKKYENKIWVLTTTIFGEQQQQDGAEIPPPLQQNIILLSKNEIKYYISTPKVWWNSNYNPRATPSGYNFEFPRTIFCHNTTL